MKKYYSVSFKYSETTYCTNLAHAENAEAVKAHYSKYEWVNVEECGQYEVETAKRKGMPIVEIESKQEVENMYDYREAVKEDILQYINDEINLEEFDTLDELEEKLNDELWTADSVTGNASGSYTFNTYEAEENICHNWELLEEALAEFGSEESPISKGAEWCDVTIRCYLLGECIAAALEEIEDDFNEAHEDEEEDEE
jgi:hypothetical protein